MRLLIKELFEKIRFLFYLFLNEGRNHRNVVLLLSKGPQIPSYLQFNLNYFNFLSISDRNFKFKLEQKFYNTIVLKLMGQPKNLNSEARLHTNDNLDRKGSDKGSKDKDKNNQEEVKSVWFHQMFRFATGFDVFLMAIGSLGACAMGAAFPAFAYIWGDMIDNFEADPSDQGDAMVEQTKETMLIFIYVGIGAFFAGWLMFGGWMITGERQGIACRKAYLKSLLKQEIGWFDLHNQSELASQFATDTFAFAGAIGQKISSVVMTTATLIAGFIFAFITGWLMTLVIMSTIPALLISGYFYMQVITEKDKNEQKNYQKAGGRAEQAIYSIKTVKQLNGENFESQAYQNCLKEVSQKGTKYAFFSGLGIAGIFFVMLASYSLGFWYGSRCVLQADNCKAGGQIYSTGDVLVVFFSVLMAGFNLGQLSPAFKKIAQGKQAAGRIYAVIDRKPLIASPENPVKIANLQGKIRFENVTFFYPKDPSRIVLKNLDLELDINKTGLVGESGCGKSTVLQLIMRFYDPVEGRVTLDGVDLKDLDLIWLREQIGYVGQEPVLFATTIKENLLFGSENATDSDIDNALRQAEAYDFVYKLENKLETYVGEGGGQLSGGQKQRIAIARAILRKPRILLLDEATSALDRRNEKLIQKTLDHVSEGRTTITIAHRVKTIMSSDIIYVFDKGGIKEKGKFHEIELFKNAHVAEEDEEVNKNKNHKHSQIKQQQQQQQQQQAGVLDLAVKPEDLQMDPKAAQEKEKKELEEMKKKYEKGTFRRLFKYSSRKIPLFALGIVMALANGVIFPVFSIFLARMFVLLLEVQFNVQAETPVPQETIDDINLYALIFLLLGIAALILMTFQLMALTLVGEEITRRIRIETFNKILKMPIPWFDKTRNNSGALTARLSTDCQSVNSMTTTVVSVKIQNMSTLITAIIIGFVFEWRTTLVAMGLLPLMIICGVIQMAFSTGFSDKTDDAFKDSVNLITESMTNIRTVSSFGYESIISKKYNEKMEKPMKLAITKGNASGFFFGLSQIIMFTIFGILFWVGSIFVRDNADVSTDDMFTAVFAILFAGMTAGNNAHFLPDEAACKNSAINLFMIQDGNDEDQIQVIEESKMIKSGINGDIVLHDVDFKYESRNQYVFRNMNLTIQKGTKAAFVGTSGCGKSTIIQLLQRFYFPEKGKITINGVDIKDYDVHYLRSCFGVVSQQPVLFNGTFKDNIKYNKENVTDEQITEAAVKANALSFIEGHEETLERDDDDGKGFNRNVGVKGSHISGGQKQRVAIARTILRNPDMLLLDEATSALDSTNEKKVQDSLDSIMRGRTVISIAHRIETIKNSDKICMFEKGVIVEEGSYKELVAKEGHFYNLERGAQFT